MSKNDMILRSIFNNIAVISCFNSSDIANFNQDVFMSINIRVSRQKIDQKKFVQSRIPSEWIEEIGTKFYPRDRDILVKLGCHEKLNKMFARVNQGEFLDEFISEYDGEKGSSSSKTGIIIHKLVKQYVDYLMTIAAKYNVPYSFVSVIRKIICFNDSHPNLAEYDNILKFYMNKDNDKNHEHTFSTPAYFPFQDFKNISKRDLEHLIGILFNNEIREIFDNNQLNTFVNKVVDYYDFYMPKNLSDEENKKIFFDVYEEIYNLQTEIVYIILFSNTIDFWIIERLKKEMSLLELKRVLADGYPLLYEKWFVMGLGSEKELDEFVDQKFFWIKIFSFLIHDLLLDKIPEATLSQTLRMQENELQFAPEYGDKRYSSSGFEKGNDDFESDDYLFGEDYTLEGKKEKEIEKWGEIDKIESVENRLTNHKQVLLLEKHFVYSTAFREQARKYLFNNYQLTGHPKTIIFQLFKYIKICTSEYLRQINNRKLKSAVGFSEKTAHRYIEQYQESNPYETDVNYIDDLPISAIESIVSAGENKIHHRIDGYISQNKLCTLLVEREPFNEKSPKTISRRLQKLINDGKIDAPKVIDSGKYFKNENVKGIINELMMDMFGSALTDKVENQ